MATERRRADHTTATCIDTKQAEKPALKVLKNVKGVDGQRQAGKTNSTECAER